MNSFNQCIRLIFEKMNNDRKVLFSGYTAFKTALKSVKIKALKENAETSSFGRQRFMWAVIRVCEEFNYENLFDFMEGVMEPDLNDFIHVLSKQFSTKGDHEVWVQGECALLLLDRDYDDVYLDKTDPLNIFLTKYNLWKYCK